MRGLQLDPRNRWRSVRDMVNEFREARKRLGQEPEGDEHRYAAFRDEQRSTAAEATSIRPSSRDEIVEIDSDADFDAYTQPVPSQEAPKEDRYYKAEYHGYADDADDDDEYEEV